MNKTDEKYIRMCFALAKRGKGKVLPNPMVGCVILDKHGNVVSKGYHKKYGEYHAERDALLKLKNNEAEGGTLYVNLEPCSHYGKTPPCVDFIIEKKLARVVFSMNDPNPKIEGENKLKKHGIRITKGVLEEEARFLNRIFIKNMTKNMPYVVLKTASTMDGKIASKTGDSKWITAEDARRYAHKLRQEFDCILTSSNTVISDNPEMKHKFKCILDQNGRVSPDSKIFKQGKIYIANKKNTPLKDGKLDLKAILKELYKQGVCSIFVECGGTLAGAFLKEGLVDEIYQFIAPKILNDNDGLSCFNGNDCSSIADCAGLKIYEIKKIGSDILIKSICV